MEKQKLYTDNSGWVTLRQSKEEALLYFVGCAELYNSSTWSADFAKTIEEVKEVNTPFKPEKRVYDAESFSEYCSELIDCWLENITSDKRYVRPVNENDCVDDDIVFMYTGRGTRMVERAIDRLRAVGCHYYDELEIEITSMKYQEC